MSRPLTRIERTAARPHYVYRHYDDAGDLLYVGCTANLRRPRQGHRHKPWWPQVVRSVISGPMAYRDAHNAEREAIVHEHPQHNKYIREPITESALASRILIARASMLGQTIGIKGGDVLRWLALHHREAVS